MIGVLYRQAFKRQAKMLMLFMPVLALYFGVIVYMYDPKMNALLENFGQMMPQVMALFGMAGSAMASMTGMLSTYLYGFLMLVFPMLYSILLTNQLISSPLRHGTMVSYLSTPHSRKEIIQTLSFVLVSGVCLLIASAFCFGVLFSSLLYPNTLDILSFALLNVGALLLHLMLAGLCFAIACACSPERSVGITTALMIFFYLMHMIANLGETFSYARFATLFTLFEPTEILAQTTKSYLELFAMLTLAVIFFSFGTKRFVRRDLSI